MRMWLPVAALAAGCAGDTLPDESLLDRQRILAARMDAAGFSEALPGDVVSVDVLAWAPVADPQVLLTVCVPDPTDLDAACPSDALIEAAKAQDFASSEGADWARDHGVLGVLPSLAATVPAPELAGPGAPSGRMYLSLGLAAWSADEADERAQVTVVVVDGASGQNLNPSPPSLRVDGEVALETLELSAGEVVRLEAFAEDQPETWTTDGEAATEAFAYWWYSDIGELAGLGFDLPLPAGEARTEMDWALPVRDADGTLYLVVRDGRGGVAWSSYPVSVR